MLKFEAVLFDMNGVIIDDERLHEHAFTEILKKYGIIISNFDYKEFFAGRTDREGLSNFIRNRSNNEKFCHIEVLLAQKNDTYQKLTATRLHRYPGVVALLSETTPLPVRRALVTSSSKLEATTVIKAFMLESTFDAVVTAEDALAGKPSPEPYLRAAEAIGVRPEKCFVIEDSPAGIQAAKAAGMFCVAVAHTHAVSQLHAADFVIPNLDKIYRKRILALLSGEYELSS